MGGRNSPYVANPTIRFHFDKIIAESDDENEIYAAKLKKWRIYIDDVLLSLKNVEEAIEVRQQISNIFAKAGMTMRKWVSSNSEVLAPIPPGHRAPMEDLSFAQDNDNDHSLSKPTKVIGISWKPNDDTFSFEQYASLGKNKVHFTKRSTSSMGPKIYDLNGYLTPFTLRGKVLLQKCWTHRDEKTGKSLGWDDDFTFLIVIL